MKLRAILLSSVFAFACLQANADVIILSDNFNSENGGVGVLNFTGFDNWVVSDGTVDLIGNGFWDLQPGHGLYVDMDGSTGNAGLMTAVRSLAAGDYVLSYVLAGNQRGSAGDVVNVAVTVSGVSASHSLAATAPFEAFSLAFSLAAPTGVSITFEGTGGDNVGMLLDDVVLTKVPDASTTVMLLGFGLVALVAARRFRR